MNTLIESTHRFNLVDVNDGNKVLVKSDTFKEVKAAQLWYAASFLQAFDLVIVEKTIPQDDGLR